MNCCNSCYELYHKPQFMRGNNHTKLLDIYSSSKFIESGVDRLVASSDPPKRPGFIHPNFVKIPTIPPMNEIGRQTDAEYKADPRERQQIIPA